MQIKTPPCGGVGEAESGSGGAELHPRDLLALEFDHSLHGGDFQPPHHPLRDPEGSVVEVEHCEEECEQVEQVLVPDHDHLVIRTRHVLLHHGRDERHEQGEDHGHAGNLLVHRHPQREAKDEEEREGPDGHEHGEIHAAVHVLPSSEKCWLYRTTRTSNITSLLYYVNDPCTENKKPSAHKRRGRTRHGRRGRQLVGQHRRVQGIQEMTPKRFISFSCCIFQTNSMMLKIAR